MVECAELLVDSVACADWAFFMKNSTDATTFANLTARAATGRKKTIFLRGYYHGNFFDNRCAIPEYWAAVRDFCTKHGIVLIAGRFCGR